jgi:hypothetical protein
MVLNHFFFKFLSAVNSKQLSYNCCIVTCVALFWPLRKLSFVLEIINPNYVDLWFVYYLILYCFFFFYKKTITIFRIIIFYFLKVLGMKFQCLKLACFSFHCLLLCLCAIETRALTHLYVHLCMLVNL